MKIIKRPDEINSVHFKITFRDTGGVNTTAMNVKNARTVFGYCRRPTVGDSPCVFVIRLALASMLTLAHCASGYSQVLIKIPTVLHIPGLGIDYVRQYREFDGRFWFGDKFLEKGKAEATFLDTSLRGNQIQAMEVFDDRLWFFHTKLSDDRKKLLMKIGYVGRGDDDLTEWGEEEFKGRLDTFLFDDKLWVLNGGELRFLTRGGKSLQGAEGRIVVTSLSRSDGPPPISLLEFGEKMWIATATGGLYYLGKGERPQLTRVSLPRPGFINGLQVFARRVLFVASEGGLFYLFPDDNAPRQMEEVTGRVKDIRSFGYSMWVKTSEPVAPDGDEATPLPTLAPDGRGFRERQYVLEAGGPNIETDLFRKNPRQKVFVRDIECGLLPVNNTAVTEGKKVKEVAEFERELFVIFDDDLSLYKLADHRDTCCMDSHQDYTWYQKEAAYGVSTIDRRLYVSTPAGITVYKTYQTVSSRGYQEEKKLPHLTVITKVFGNDKGLWFFAGGKNSISRWLYHLDQNAHFEAYLSSSDSFLKSLVEYLMPGNYLLEGQTNLHVRVLNEKNEKVYKQDAIEGLLASAKAGDADATVNDNLGCEHNLSQVKDVRPEVRLGRQRFCFMVADAWGNQATLTSQVYRGVPNLLSALAVVPMFFALLALLVLLLAPYSKFCHDLVMNPALRRYGSFGLLPLALTVFPPARRHILKRYSEELSKDRAFGRHFIYPSDEFHPEKFGVRIERARKIMLLGQSGIGKTSYFRRLARHYAAAGGRTPPGEVVPVFVSLANYQGGNTLDGLIHDQLQSLGRLSDKEHNDWFLKQGGFLIIFDGVNEIPEAGLRASLAQFIERNWRANYICLSSQQAYPEFEGLTQVKVKPLDREKIHEYVRLKLAPEAAAGVISEFTEKSYQLYQIPRNLDFAIEIKQRDARLPLPQERDELYERVLWPILSEWEANGRTNYPDLLYRRAYRMLVTRDTYFAGPETGLPEDLINSLSDERYRLLVKLAGKYVFQHDLLRAFLASKHFFPRWKKLLREEGVMVDYNWLEMLRFTILSSGDPLEVEKLMLEILEKGETTSVVGDLFNWLKTQDTKLYEAWEDDFKLRFATKQLEELN